MIHCENLLNEAVADPTWVKANFCIVVNMVYMEKQKRHVKYAVCNNNKQVRKKCFKTLEIKKLTLGVSTAHLSPAHTWCSPLLLN